MLSLDEFRDQGAYIFLDFFPAHLEASFARAT